MTADAQPPAARRADRREIFGWSMYSWADHAFITTVGAVLIGPYLLSLATGAVGRHGDLVSLGPLRLSAAAYPSFVITVSVLVQVLVLPVLGATADALRAKKILLALCCGAGAVLTGLLATAGAHAWLYAGLVYLAANVVFGAGNVIYNAYLPDLVGPQRRDEVSGRGFAFGYLGGGLLLAANLGLLQLHDQLGLSKGAAVRWCFLAAAFWWAGFGGYAIRRLPGAASMRAAPTGRLGSGLGELRATLRLLRGMPQTLRYLLAYLFFTDAISAVIALSSTFITHELYSDDADRSAPFLFALILLIQFVAMLGSLAFVRIARGLGSKRTILVTLVVWCAVIVYAYGFLHDAGGAVAMGVVIGLVLGGSQALARSVYSQMIPVGREGTFFGFYQICDQGTSWLAPLVFTVVVSVTGSYRQAILSLVVLFAIGIVLLARSDVGAAVREAQLAGVG